jgi:hypothetical protein
MCRGTILCREEIENVPKNFNSTNFFSNFLLFWTLKELIKLPLHNMVINLTIHRLKDRTDSFNVSYSLVLFWQKNIFRGIVPRPKLSNFLCRESKKFENHWDRV